MTDFGDFDLDRSTAEAWEAFTERLGEVLSVMDATADLNISVVPSGDHQASPTVRFSAIGPELIEASLHDVQPETENADELRQLGWDRDEQGAWRVSRHQEESQELAEIASSTLSRVVGALHPVFLQPDQLAEVLVPVKPGSVSESAAVEALGVVVPHNQAHLDAAVDEELDQIFGHPPLRNPDGDVTIRVGSTMVFLRSTPDCRELLLFASLVHDVAGRSRACEVLNDLNVEARYCRFALHRDRVFVQMSVPAQPFVPAHLRQALDNLSQVADAIDDELASRLGGRTTFPTAGHGDE